MILTLSTRSALSLLALLAPPQSVKLNAPLLAGPVTGDVSTYLRTPDGAHALYSADPDSDGTNGLFIVPTDGSQAPRTLVAHLARGPLEPLGWSASPDGAWLAYAAGSGARSVYAVPTDGSAAPRLLADGSPGIQSVRFTPDGTRVVFARGDGAGGGPDELLGVPLDASQPALVLATARSFDPARFVPGNGLVLVLAESAATGRDDLFVVPADGSAAPHVLNAPLPVGGSFRDYAGTADGTRVVYLADQNTHNRFELFGAKLQGTGVRLNDPPVAGHVFDFELTPDGARALFRANFRAADAPELYSVPVDGSASPVNFNPLTPVAVNDYEIAPDGARVALASEQGVVSAPVAAGAYTVLSGTPATSVRVSPDSLTLAFTARDDKALWTGPLDGSQVPLQITPSLSLFGRTKDVVFTPGGARLAYLSSPNGGSPFHPYSVPVDGSHAAVRLDRLSDFDLGPPVVDDARALFVAARDNRDVRELLASALTGGPPLALSAPFDASVAGDVGAFELTADGARAVYLAGPRGELASASLERTPARGTLGFGDAFRLSPDGARAAFRGYAGYSPNPGAPPRLRITAVDGSTASLPLTNRAVEAFEFSADGTWLVFIGQEFSLGVNELFAVRADGNGADVRLSLGMNANRTLSDLALVRGVDRALYLCDRDVLGARELYSVPADHHLGAVKLNLPLVAGRSVAYFVAAPGGERVAYVADQDADDDFDLYSVQSDGGAPPARLDVAFATTAGPFADTLRFSPDGARLVYCADALVPGRFELFSAPADLAQPPVRLNAPLPAASDVFGFALFPDGSRVAFACDVDGDGRAELSVAPLDGSLAPLVVSAPGQSASAPEVSADGRFVLYLADARDLFLAPVDGSRPARQLDAPFGSVAAFRGSPDGARALFTSDRDDDLAFQLHEVPLALARAPRRVNGVLVPEGDVRGGFGEPGAFAFTPDGRRAVYVADQELDDVFELFFTDLGPPHRAR